MTFDCFPSSRSTHDLVAMDGWLYAVGGNDGSSSLNSIEKYNPRSNKWVAASCMFTRRSSVGVAVLELLNFPPPSSPTLSVSSTSLWHGVTTWLTSASAATAQAGSGKRRNCSVWDGEEDEDKSGQVNKWRGGGEGNDGWSGQTSWFSWYTVCLRIGDNFE